MKVRVGIRHARRSPGGRPVLAFGVRVGYWPCMGAAFVELAFASWRFEAWAGRP